MTTTAPRLNVWHRLGIVASVVWLIGAGIVELNRIEDEATARADALLNLCREYQAQGYEPTTNCFADWSKHYELATDDAFSRAALVAGIPISLAWISAYLVIWTTRWVMHGRKVSA